MQGCSIERLQGLINQDLYQCLCKVAIDGGITNYSKIAPIVSLDMANIENRNQMSALLDEISYNEHKNGRPLLSAVVIHMEDNIPGNGFFTLAKDLGLFRGKDRLKYFAEELCRVHAYWRGKTI